MSLKIPIIIATVLCCHPLAQAASQESPQELLTSTNVLSLKNAYESTDGTLNFRNFSVEVLESGNYHAAFWLQPALYADGSYTTFDIYVNGTHAGAITPTNGNWQSAAIDDSPSITLSSGTNVISVATPSPEVPAVESVRLARNGNAVAFSSTAYDTFMQEAKNPNRASTMSETAASSPETTGNATGYATFANVPLKYSTYKFFTFNKGDDIHFQSSSTVEHVIDVAYCGVFIKNTMSTNDNSTTANGHSTNNPSNNIISNNILLPSTEEMQGLNWKFPSEVSAGNANRQVAKGIITIPKTGLYMVKMRSAKNGLLSIANLVVNNKYSYESAPIYYSSVDYEIPADGNYYSAIAISPETATNPMLFVEGADAERIVGFYYDTQSPFFESYKPIIKRNAYIIQSYLVKTTGLHACNFSSSSPETSCNILINPLNPTIEAQQPLRTMAADATGIELADSRVAVSPNPVSRELSVTISSTNEISRIDAYGIAGSRVTSVPASGHSVTIPLADLGIHEAGMYVLNVTTSGGKESTHNIIVK